MPRAVSITIGTSELLRSVRQTSDAVTVRQVEVEQDEVGIDPPGEVQRLRGRLGDDRLEAVSPQRLGERLEDRRLVLDEEDLAWEAGARPRGQCNAGDRPSAGVSDPFPALYLRLAAD